MCKYGGYLVLGSSIAGSDYNISPPRDNYLYVLIPREFSPVPGLGLGSGLGCKVK